MASDPGSGRRYTDEEVQKLLKRASDLEREGKYHLAPADGPTLQELEAIAQEAGLNPMALREAARELDAHGEGNVLPSEKTRGFLGAPVAIVLRRTIPGEAPEAVLKSLLPVLQRAAGGMGQSSGQGKTLTWQCTNPGATRTLLATFSTFGGGTQIVLEERYENLAWAIHGGVIGGGGGGIGLGVGLGVGLGAALSTLGTIAFATLFPLGALGGSYLLSRRIYAAVVRRRSEAVQALMEELEAMVEARVDPNREARLGQGPEEGRRLGPGSEEDGGEAQGPEEERRLAAGSEKDGSLGRGPEGLPED